MSFNDFKKKIHIFEKIVRTDRHGSGSGFSSDDQRDLDDGSNHPIYPHSEP